MRCVERARLSSAPVALPWLLDCTRSGSDEALSVGGRSSISAALCSARTETVEFVPIRKSRGTAWAGARVPDIRGSSTESSGDSAGTRCPASS
jgi:hypothetical protein